MPERPLAFKPIGVIHTVEHVGAFDMKLVALPPRQFHEAQSDGIGTAGRAGGEHTAHVILEKGLGQQLRLSRLVQVVDQIEM